MIQKTYLGISVTFMFSLNSVYSKLSDHYNDGHRPALAEHVKEDITNEIKKYLFKDISFNWFGDEKDLYIFPSVMEIGGCAEIDNSELDNYVTKSTLSSISKHLDEKFLSVFGKDTSCHVNVYFIENRQAVMIDTWKKN